MCRRCVKIRRRCASRIARPVSQSEQLLFDDHDAGSEVSHTVFSSEGIPQFPAGRGSLRTCCGAARGRSRRRTAKSGGNFKTHCSAKFLLTSMQSSDCQLHTTFSSWCGPVQSDRSRYSYHNHRAKLFLPFRWASSRSRLPHTCC